MQLPSALPEAGELLNRPSENVAPSPKTWTAEEFMRLPSTLPAAPVPSAASVGLHAAERAVGPMYAASVAAPWGAAYGGAAGTAVLPGAGTVVGGLVGAGIAGAGAAFLASGAQEFLLSLIPQNILHMIGQSTSDREADLAAHKYVAYAGETVPQLLTMRPGLVVKTAMAGKSAFERLLATQAGSHATGAVTSGALDVGMQLGQTGEIDPIQTALAVASGAALNKETGHGESIRLRSESFIPGNAARVAAERARLNLGNTAPPPIPHPENTPNNAPDTITPIMAAPDIDGITAAAANVAGTPVADPLAAAGIENAPDAAPTADPLNTPEPLVDADDSLDRYGGLNEGRIAEVDGGYHYIAEKNGMEVSTPLPEREPRKLEEGETPVEGEITHDIAEAQKEHYGQYGMKPVYLAADVPFEGAVSPDVPNTIFLSIKTDGNVAQVGAHELGHLLESTTLPDGTNLGDKLHQAVGEELNTEGWTAAWRVFESTGPKRTSFPEGPVGASRYADAVVNHMIKEMSADLHGEAPKFETFIPKVLSAIERRWPDQAKDIMKRFMDGIKTAMETFKKFFGTGDTFSQHYLKNMERIHDIIAEQHAAKLGEIAGLPMRDPAAPASPVRGERPGAPRTGAGGAVNLDTGEITFGERPAGTQFSPRRDTEERRLVVPLPPGGSPVPEGFVRRYHVTSPENAQKIAAEGLLQRNARGIEGPSAMYSWADLKDAQEYAGTQGAIVEFYDDPNHYKSNSYARYGDVPPENVLAVHEPWHGMYRRAKSDGYTAADLRAAAMGNPESDYGKTATALERDERKTQFSPKREEVETPEFKSWFGRSTVVDKQGAPQVLYHGTTADISTFSNEDAPSRGGILTFLTTSKKFASDYATEGEGANILPVYARIERPFDFRKDWKSALDFYYETGGIRDPYEARRILMGRGKAESIEDTSVGPDDLTANMFANSIRKGNWDALEAGEFVEWLRGAGHDGIITKENGAINYAVFEPTQIKSALGNRGTFDPSDARTQFSPRRKATEERAEGKPVPDSVAATTSLENAQKIAASKVWDRGRQLKEALQASALSAAESAGVNLSDRSHATVEHLTKAVVADFRQAFKKNANAVGWYGRTLSSAMRIVALMRPELATDADARFAFTYALAVTSNGQKVNKNFDYTDQVYEHYKRTGEMPTNIQAGTSSDSMNSAFETFNTLKKQIGLETFRKFMLSDYTMAEITALTGIKPSGEHADTRGRGAAIIGPKIGNGFFSNLYGDFSALTMDRWLIRTWGRLTGNLIEAPGKTADDQRVKLSQALRDTPQAELDRLSELVGYKMSPGMNYVDDLAVAIQKASADKKLRAELNSTTGGEAIRKSANMLAKYLDGQKEAPADPGERTYIREVFAKALTEIRKTPGFEDLTMADLQAVLWYGERDLYSVAKSDVPDASERGFDTDGIEEPEAPTNGKIAPPADYETAALKLLRARNAKFEADPALTPEQKKLKIVSERRIAGALKKKDEENGPAGPPRSGDVSGPQKDSVEGGVRGFTEDEKRAFRGARTLGALRSGRLGDASPSWRHTRGSAGDGKGLGLLKKLGATHVARWVAGADLRRVLKKGGNAVPEAVVELDRNNPANAAVYARLVADAKKILKYGAAVTAKTPEEYQGSTMLLANNGKSGAVVTSDGDIVSVFSTDGSGRAMLDAAIAAGGRKLDAVDTILPDFYHDFGFVETGRLKWDDAQAPVGWDKKLFAKYNNGEPDIVLMALDRTSTPPAKLATAKTYATWDEAAAAQERFVKAANQNKPAAIVNLRLDRKGGGKRNTPAQAIAEIEKSGARVVASRVHPLPGKPGASTMVAHLSRALSPDEATALSAKLGQDVIAQKAERTGQLHGPRPESWGEFDPTKFKALDGGTAWSPRRRPEDDYRRPTPEPVKTPQESPVAPVPARPVETPAPAPKPATEVPTQAAPAKEAPREKQTTPLHNIPGSVRDRETRVLGLARSVEIHSVAAGLGSFEHLGTYNRAHNEDQARRGLKERVKDPAKFWDIAMGRASPPSWMLPETAFVIEVQKATEAGDAAKLQELATKSALVRAAKTMGQRIQMLSQMDPDSPVTKMQALTEARKTALEKKGVKVDAVIEKDVSDMTRAIDAEIKATAKSTKRQNWNEFLMSIICKI